MSLFSNRTTRAGRSRLDRLFAPRSRRARPHPISLEALEERSLLAYTFALSGATATVTGDAAGGALVIDQVGGLLEHQVNGGAFSTDWDDATTGIQTLAAAATSTVNISSTGPSTITFGTPTAPASTLLANLVAQNGDPTDSLTIDDSGNSAVTTYSVTDNSVTATGINVDIRGAANAGGVTLLGGSAANTYNIRGTFAGEPETVTGGAGNDTVNVTAADIGSGTSFTTNGGPGTDTLNVDAARETTVNSATPGTISFGAGATPITYSNFEQVNITNAPSTPPTGAAAVMINPTEGQNLANAEVATFTDPDAGARASQFTATINWGDTTSASAGTITQDAQNPSLFHVTGTHTYLEEGTDTVTVTVQNNGGSNTVLVGSVPITTTTIPGDATPLSPTGSAVVADAALTATPMANIPATVGSALPNTTVVASFTDANPNATVSDFTATINWGDGSSAAGTVVANPAGGFNVTGSHTYTAVGTDSVTVAINDVGGSMTSAASTANVFEAPITSITAAPILAVEGQPFTGETATFTSGNTLARASDFTSTIDWGDGASTAGTITEDASRTFHVVGTHTFAEEGPFAPVVTVRGVNSIATTGFGNQTNLVSDTPGLALHTDPNLVKPWGIVASATSPFWISDNGAGVSTLYNGAGVAVPLVVTIPAVNGNAASAPTGVVNNGVTTDFFVGGAGTFAHFIFATEDGTIAAWNSGTTAVLKVNNSQVPTAANGAVYKGAALDTIGASQFLYVTNFRAGTVEVYDSTFAPHTFSATQFTDTTIPAGFAPFGIANIGGKLYVTYAKQNAAKHDDVAGVGNGFIDIYNADGSFVQRFASNGPLNSPWGLAVAPANFGAFSNDLLVGNFGDGHITAYNPTTGALVGPLTVGTTGTPITIKGLWGLAFGNGTPTAPTNTLYFTAGINDEADGLFGTLTELPSNLANLILTVADAPLTNPVGVPVLAKEQGFGNTLALFPVATFTDADPNGTISDFTATIDWGDGTPTDGLIFVTGATPNGQVFTVEGSHRYAEEGTYPITVTIKDAGGSQTVTHSQATITDAALMASPVTVSATEGQPFTGTVATFTDANNISAIIPSAVLPDYSATINWGDGTPETVGSIVPSNTPAVYNVIGTHTYADSGVNGGTGQFLVTVTIHDVGGSSAVATSTAVVNDVEMAFAGVLNPASDTGQSNTDHITNNPRPNFIGFSEPGSTVILDAQPLNGGPAFPIGVTTTDAAGFWTLNSFTLPDGRYTITGIAIDKAGKTTASTTVVPTAQPLVIDTVGPRVTNVTFDRLHGQIDVTFQDDRSGMDQASLLNAVNYTLVKHGGPKSGPFVLTSIAPTQTGNPTAPETVVLTFNGGRQIRGGLFTFTILSGSGVNGVRDIAGNALDGEFFGRFPSGNGVPGGNFVAEVDTFHHKVFAPKSVVGSSSPVATPAPTVVPTTNPGTQFITNATSLKKTGLQVHSKGHAVHDAALAHIQVKRVRHH